MIQFKRVPQRKKIKERKGKGQEKSRVKQQYNRVECRE